jgi:NADH-quinone oxidoreductase subunit C
MTFQDQLNTSLQEKQISFQVEGNSSPHTLKIEATLLVSVCQHLQADHNFYFDQLTNVTGIDNGPEVKTMEVIYHLYSIPFNYSLALKVVVPRENPEVESLSSLWKSANWLEREVYDMFGIQFRNHPDLRRILMPADWEGHPLRKDYQQQETYRDVKVKY